MTIRFQPYVRKDKSLMLYINRSNGVSIGISPQRDFAPYGKDSTQGKRNAYSAALKTFFAHAKRFTGDLSKHTEGGFCAPVVCGDWTLVGTDVANIGGMDVGADGSYLIRTALGGTQWILYIGVAWDEPETPAQRRAREIDEAMDPSLRDDPDDFYDPHNDPHPDEVRA